MMGRARPASSRAALLLLAVIPPAIVAALVFKGRIYDPAYVVPAGAPAASVAGPVPATLAGWILQDGAWFPAAEMYRKIDGRAQFYEQFGVEGLQAGTWARATERWDMYLYKMSGARAAGGAFAGERPESAASQDLRYGIAGQCAAHQGEYYVQLVAVAPGAAPGAVTPLMDAILASLPASAEPAQAPGAKLPEAKQVAGSAGREAKNAFGYTSLANVQFAHYSVGGAEATWFIADGGSAAFSAYTNELVRYGGQNVFALSDAVGGEMFGSWEIAGVVDDSLAGVRDATGKDVLLAHWETLKTQLGAKP